MRLTLPVVAFRERLRHAAASWGAAPVSVRISFVLVAIMIAGGVVLRAQGLGMPVQTTFDEHHFVPNAHRYLVGLPDENDHPPLGKLLMAIGLLLFDKTPVGWRFSSLVFGLQSVLIGGWLARHLFGDRRAGWLAAAFIAADGFFIAYSRTGLLDGVLSCLVLWSMLAAVTARGAAGVLASATLVGLAASVKWSGAMAAIPAALAVLMLRKTSRWNVLWFGAVPVVHGLVWMGALRMTGRPSSPMALMSVMATLLRQHVQLGHETNPLASPWYSWLVMFHPIVVKLWWHGVTVRNASSVGNPVLSLAALGAVPVIAGGALAGRLARRWSLFRRAGIDAQLGRAGLLAIAGWFALLAPWIVGRGTYTFWYHYMPSHGFALVLLAGVAAYVQRRRPLVVLGGLLAAVAVAAWLAPVWGELALSQAAADRRLIFVPWRP